MNERGGALGAQGELHEPEQVKAAPTAAVEALSFLCTPVPVFLSSFRAAGAFCLVLHLER